MVAAPLYYVAAASYGSFALEVVRFGSLVAGSAALDADRVHHGTSGKLNSVRSPGGRTFRRSIS